MPTDAETILKLMDEASKYAETGQGVTSATFDHAMRVFNQLNAHYKIAISKEIADAHKGLRDATIGLKISTWWLAAITIILGFVEVYKILIHAS